MLHLEEERRNTKKEIERFDKRQKITEGSWRKQYELLVQIMLEEETEKEKMIKELDDLKETVEELKQKARDMDAKMMGVGWFQKLLKKKKIKRKQFLEKEIERLEHQLKESEAREAWL
ncbi:hypothetical protein Q7C36_016723 [Tachysurus vachellii]|uniref:Uncharacterized protein n=1 Tax=Tachysurus vachellii TaxID=175792 RepID=A0AA88M837_TACVA|nr:hypothetical protein Q7C36_016723 [Tachysurus vachellii]